MDAHVGFFFQDNCEDEMEVTISFWFNILILSSICLTVRQRICVMMIVTMVVTVQWQVFSNAFFWN